VLHIYIYDISRLRVNWLVFITGTKCVYCSVRAESLNVIKFSFFWKLDIAQKVSRRTVIAEGWVLCQLCPCEILRSKKCHWDMLFSQYFGIPLSAYPSSSICCCYQKDKLAKPGNLTRSNSVSEFRKHGIEK